MSRFLVLEGVDGSGKSTQAEALCRWLRRAGRNPLHLREPGSTAFGEAVRSLLLDPQLQQRSARSEALLFFAARREMLRQQVAPALAAGREVVCERFTPSTYAYQGSDPADAALVLDLELQVLDRVPRPDRILIFDLPASVSLARAVKEGAGDGFEQRGLEYFEGVRRRYQAYAKARAEVCHLCPVDGLTVEQVGDLLRATLAPWYGLSIVDE